MSSKAELNRDNQRLASEATYWKVRYNGQLEKNGRLQKRLARRRNGIFRRAWLRIRSLWHK